LASRLASAPSRRSDTGGARPQRRGGPASSPARRRRLSEWSLVLSTRIRGFQGGWTSGVMGQRGSACMP
jgi:hypothetical protein